MITKKYLCFKEKRFDRKITERNTTCSNNDNFNKTCEGHVLHKNSLDKKACIFKSSPN